MSDPRIGKQGEYRPKTTLCGFEVSASPAITIGVGGGYYVELHPFPCADWQERLAEVKVMVKKELTPKADKRPRKDNRNEPETFSN